MYLPGYDKYILIDTAAADTLYHFNVKGEWVKSDVRLTLMHGFAHLYLNDDDPLKGEATQADMNAMDFDFRGPCNQRAKRYCA
jgi:hypothetical protein